VLQNTQIQIHQNSGSDPTQIGCTWDSTNSVNEGASNYHKTHPWGPHYYPRRHESLLCRNDKPCRRSLARKIWAKVRFVFLEETRWPIRNSQIYHTHQAVSARRFLIVNFWCALHILKKNIRKIHMNGNSGEANSFEGESKVIPSVFPKKTNCDQRCNVTLNLSRDVATALKRHHLTTKIRLI